MSPQGASLQHVGLKIGYPAPLIYEHLPHYLVAINEGGHHQHASCLRPQGLNAFVHAPILWSLCGRSNGVGRIFGVDSPEYVAQRTLVSAADEPDTAPG